ncbi:MAG TPA: hypothetical protein VK474_00320 [Chthoniobacterales bacterium]|nr:hypothetical protein [Chthoniobacterales bacterium]
MSFRELEQLPFVGISHQFLGEKEARQVDLHAGARFIRANLT